MNEITIEQLLNLIKTYNEEAIPDVKRAYQLADFLHKGQLRQSGEPYIIHPLNVSYILATMHADCDTLCAGLLHDTLEDTHITKEEIAKLFNQNVANLVDGVTKLAKMNFSSKQEQNLANTRKIITGITEDVRIIIIKLADRLHNMRTLEYKKPFKQKENALETLEIFSPLAYYLGAYQIKNELEDLSLRYLKPEIYHHLEEQKNSIEEANRECLYEMLHKIKMILNENDIPNEIKVRTKNIYGIYKKLEQGHQLNDIHDLLAIKIIVDKIDNCYKTLGLVHRLYKPINHKFKDYISNPKTNLYQSLHTTVFAPNEQIVQTQIRTFEMDRTATYGLTASWDINKGNARYVMQEDLKNKFQFFKYLTEIDTIFSDNQAFVEQVKTELFNNNVYAYTPSGICIELPKGSTIIDYAYKTDPQNADNIVDAIVNDKSVPIDYIIQNKDRIKIITSKLSKGPTPEWETLATTSYAKKRIREYPNNHHLN